MELHYGAQKVFEILGSLLASIIVILLFSRMIE
jgi:hypothetical protein